MTARESSGASPGPKLVKMPIREIGESLAASARDALLAAFCSASAPEVFESIVYQQQIWTPDPFDVVSIHGPAREVFGRLLARAATDPPPPHGKILLLHGESGSGKTHLMRAFRHVTHSEFAGYFAYLQMTTEASNYGRYLLRHLIDSLDQPFLSPIVEMSGLMRLSTGVLDAVPDLSSAELEAFRDGSNARDAAELALEYADRSIRHPTLQDCDLDLMRALIHLQRDDPRIKARVIKWLRCEDLAPVDRAALGGIVPRLEEDDPIQMVEQFARLMTRLYAVPLVICVDQMEDVFQQDQGPARFRKVVEALITLADRVPTSVAVVACLEDYYKANREHLARSKMDRLERDPEPQRLSSEREWQEVQDLISVRLEALYGQQSLKPDAQMPTYPFRPDVLHRLVGLRTRDVLDACRMHHQQCVLAGAWSEPDWPATGPLVIAQPVEQPAPPSVTEQAWNEYRSAFTQDLPDEELELASLLAYAIERASLELPEGLGFSAATEERLLFVSGPSREGQADGKLLVAVCNRRAQGGGLGRQVADAQQKAGKRPLVLVRSTAFPQNANSLVGKQIGKIISAGGRRVVVENADWRAMLAFRAFVEVHKDDPTFTAWQRASQPLSQLPALRRILDLDNLPLPAPKAASTASPAEATNAAAKAPAAPTAAPQAVAPDVDAPLLLGHAKGLGGGVVTIEPSELKQHMALLGGPGSGKTTAALCLIEQLLQRGIPAVFVDRKGDLSRYADPQAYDASAADARLFDGKHAEFLQQFHQRIDVRLYTPGAQGGRALAIPVVPEGLAGLTSAEREETARFAGAALSQMMGYRSKGADQILQAILTKAIEVLVQNASQQTVSVEALQQIVGDQDDALLNAVGGYEPKHYKKLAQDLLTLKLQNGRLLSTAGDPLDIDALFGRGSAAVAGKTRLTIVNTQFLGSNEAADFWVAQLLMALDRWRTKSPSEKLQAVVLLDEADLYLPAIRQPATKAPLESLLRRARSAGLGFFLSTQTPGDLDYKCRENIRAWVVGRVKEQVGLNKLKPMFSDARLDAAARLPGQETGEFHLLREGKVVALKAQRSLVETRQLSEQEILELARL